MGLFDLFERNDNGKVIEISVDNIVPSRYQPRLTFDEDAIQELSESIQTNGLITPITVRMADDHYEIIAGERRFRACIKAGFKTIPCYVLSPSESQAAEMALIENIQRENLTAIEEAKAYVQIMKQSSLTQEQVAKQVGKSQSAVANKIRLLNLPEIVQEAVLDKSLSERQARALLSLPREDQVMASYYVQEHNLNVRQTEEYVEKLKAPKEQKPKKIKKKTKGFSRNIKLGLNSVNQCVEMIRKMGIAVETETIDDENEVSVVLKFPK